MPDGCQVLSMLSGGGFGRMRSALRLPSQGLPIARTRKNGWILEICLVAFGRAKSSPVGRPRVRSLQVQGTFANSDIDERILGVGAFAIVHSTQLLTYT